MGESQMQPLVDSHMGAEGRGISKPVVVYTDNIEHDVVGFPSGPTSGKDGARNFYAHLIATFRTESWNVLHRYVAGDAVILELLMTGTVIASLLGLPGKRRRIGFRDAAPLRVPARGD